MSLLLESPVKRTTMILMALDANFALAVIIVCGFFFDRNPISIFQDHPWLLLVPLSLPLFLHAGRLYNLRRNWLSPGTWLQAVMAVVAIVLFFFVCDRYFSGTKSHTGIFFAMVVAVPVEVIVVRSFAALKTLKSRSPESVLVVGTGWAANQVVDTIIREPRLGMRVVGMVDDNHRVRNLVYKGVPVVGGREGLKEAAEAHGVRLVITTDPDSQRADLIEALFGLKTRGVEIVDMSRFFERATGQVPIGHVGDSWFLYSGGFDLLHRSWVQKVKRFFDIVISLVALVFSLPIMALTALLIKCDSRGPVFFRQERTGQDEKPFLLIKFRTMREDAERGSGPVWASANDNRITRVGRLLRVTRLDEIPQFLNVLRGEMSFIGPRPERPFFVENLKKEIPYYSFRFTVKPGLSGWAQVNYQYGASTDDAVEKLKYELYYIKNMSMWLDLFIVFKTLKTVILAKGT